MVVLWAGSLNKLNPCCQLHFSKISFRINKAYLWVKLLLSRVSFHTYPILLFTISFLFLFSCYPRPSWTFKPIHHQQGQKGHFSHMMDINLRICHSSLPWRATATLIPSHIFSQDCREPGCLEHSPIFLPGLHCHVPFRPVWHGLFQKPCFCRIRH